jgi:hypothetical protein
MTRLDRDKVSEPMDMNSIIRRVEVGFYGNEYDDFAKVNPFTSVSLSLTVPLLAQDVRQMWTNCQLYNPPRSPIYLSSKRFASPPLSSSVPPLLSSCHRLGEYFESLYSQFLKKVSSHSVHTAQESD